MKVDLAFSIVCAHALPPTTDTLVLRSFANVARGHEQMAMASTRSVDSSWRANAPTH